MMRSKVLCAAVVLAAGLVLVAAGGAATGTLPGGTSIAVSITTPHDGDTLPLGDVSVSGTASVGQGVAVANTLLITVIDVSGSTSAQTGVCPNQNPLMDAVVNTTLDCELLAAKTLNQAATSSGTVEQVGLIGFGGTPPPSGNLNDAAALDLDPAGGIQSLIAPGDPGVGTPWVEQVLASAYLAQFHNINGGDGFAQFTDRHFVPDTNFWAAIEAVKSLAQSATQAHTHTVVAFLSDGVSNTGGPGNATVSQALAQLLAAVTNITIDTFAIGNQSTCTGGSFGSLQQIALATGGVCSQISDPTDAAASVPGVIASQLSSISLTADGNAVPVSTGTLPAAGPASVGFSATVSGLTAGPHQLCATAGGSDGGGTGSVQDCVNVTLKAPPTITGIGDGSNGLAGEVNEGSPFALNAAVDGATTTSWVASGGTGTCTFADASAPSTSVTCDDDGVYTLTLTASDGVNPPVSFTEHLQVDNVAPTLVITSPTAGASDRSVSFSANVTDPGNDPLTCTIDWGDGSAPATAAVIGGACTATHTYAASTIAATIGATAADDDGGVSAPDSVSLTFNRPPVCTAVVANTAVLWPANHRLVLVSLGGATDPDAGDTVSYHVDGVTQDEPLLGTGSGDTSPDAVLAAGGSVWLRAERAGTGDGRVYTVAFTVSDSHGATCSGTTLVGVPHDAAHGAVPTPGASYNSLG